MKRFLVSLIGAVAEVGLCALLDYLFFHAFDLAELGIMAVVFFLFNIIFYKSK